MTKYNKIHEGTSFYKSQQKQHRAELDLLHLQKHEPPSTINQVS